MDPCLEGLSTTEPIQKVQSYTALKIRDWITPPVLFEPMKSPKLESLGRILCPVPGSESPDSQIETHLTENRYVGLPTFRTDLSSVGNRVDFIVSCLLTGSTYTGIFFLSESLSMFPESTRLLELQRILGDQADSLVVTEEDFASLDKIQDSCLWDESQVYKDTEPDVSRLIEPPLKTFDYPPDSNS